jgi:hypothetical protein
MRLIASSISARLRLHDRALRNGRADQFLYWQPADPLRQCALEPIVCEPRAVAVAGKNAKEGAKIAPRKM